MKEHSDWKEGLNAQVSAEIRAELARRRLRQQDLAAGVGMTRAQVNARLRGATPWNLDEVRTVALFLNVDVWSLFLPPEVVS